MEIVSEMKEKSYEWTYCKELVHDGCMFNSDIGHEMIKNVNKQIRWKLERQAIR